MRPRWECEMADVTALQFNGPLKGRRPPGPLAGELSSGRIPDYSEVRAAMARIAADPLGIGPLWPGAPRLDGFYANAADIPPRNIEPHDWRWVLRQTWPYRLADGIINSSISGVTLAGDAMD